jgi:SAM-dependent methyltransferase
MRYGCTVDECDRESAHRIRSLLERGLQDPVTFRRAILSIPRTARDAWLDLVLGLGDLPDDGPELPRDCVPYLPCSVDPLLRLVEQARVGPSDVFVDVGSGVGRASALVHLLTGAGAIGLEIQPALVQAARDLARRLPASRVSTVQGDAAELAGYITIGSVFFLYCPFSGHRLAKVLAGLESIAWSRTIRVCCVDLPLPRCRWLTLESPSSGDLTIHRSTVV